MPTRLLPAAILPLLSGCVVVHHRQSAIDLGDWVGPLTDASLAGRLLAIAACSGLLGGAVAWLVARSRSGRRDHASTATGATRP